MGTTKEIIAPTNCPSCGYLLEFNNDQLYCLNEDCDAKTQKFMENWCKTVKVKGLGPKNLEKLEVFSLEDLYQLSKEDLVNVLGEKIGEKIYLELENSKLAPLNVTLPAFNIRLVGKSATEKLAQNFSHLAELTEESVRNAGLGQLATKNLLSWYNEVYLVRYKDRLPLNFTFNKPSSIKERKGIVCISGKLSSYKTKAEAEKVLREHGYEVKSSVTKEVTILVNESGVESAKTQKARESGVNVITNITQLLER